MDRFCIRIGFMRPLCWGIEVVFWLVSFLGCSLVTVSGFRMYFIRSSSIAGGQLPCCSWTRAHSFSRSLPGCAKCLIGCRAYTSGQTDGDSKGQSSGGFRSWSRCLPSLPWQQLLCLPRPHSPRPQALPFLCGFLAFDFSELISSWITKKWIGRNKSSPYKFYCVLISSLEPAWLLYIDSTISTQKEFFEVNSGITKLGSLNAYDSKWYSELKELLFSEMTQKNLWI